MVYEKKKEPKAMKIYKQKASGRIVEVDEGFNFFVVLFGCFWYLYKGMIGRAILAFFGVLLLTIFSNSAFGSFWIGAIIGWIIMGATANKSYEDYLILKGYSIIRKGKK